MSQPTAARFPDLFGACVSISGIVDFEEFFAQTTAWMAAISAREYGNPATEAELLRKLSPMQMDCNRIGGVRREFDCELTAPIGSS